MSIKPLANRVVVKPDAVKKQTDSGIILPENKRPVKGTVIAVGRGETDSSGTVVPMVVKKGNRVLYGQFSGTEILVEGQEYLIMKETDIFAIID